MAGALPARPAKKGKQPQAPQQQQQASTPPQEQELLQLTPQQVQQVAQQQEPQVVATPEGLFLPPSAALPTALPLPRVQRVLPWHAASKGELVVPPPVIVPPVAPTKETRDAPAPEGSAAGDAEKGEGKGKGGGAESAAAAGGLGDDVDGAAEAAAKKVVADAVEGATGGGLRFGVEVEMGKGGPGGEPSEASAAIHNWAQTFPMW